MNTSPLVSSVMIFLNAARFIDEAIESVRAQRYTNWELLLVDDGSTDGSSDVARRFAECEPGRIRYLQHPGGVNRGMSASRNLGIRQARGELIAPLDADDVWLPGKLEDQVPKLLACPSAAMLFARTNIWFSWTGLPSDAKRDSVNDFGFSGDTLVEPPGLLAKFLADESSMPCCCSVLIRRSTFDCFGMFEESFRGSYEDMIFYSKVFSAAPVLVLDGCWDRYRQHADSACAIAVRNGEHRYMQPSSARGKYLHWIENHLRAAGVTDARLLQVLDEQLWPYRHPRQYAMGRWIERNVARGRRALGRLRKAPITDTVATP